MLTITAIATKRFDDPMPTNVQHLMGRLSDFFQINYIEPPVDAIYLLRNLKCIHRLFRKTKLNHFKKYIPIILPFENRFPKIKKINEKIILIQIKLFLKFNKSNTGLLWIFSPKHSFLAGQLSENKLYFHITDDNLAFPEKAGLGPLDQLKFQEEYIMQKADRIFVTSAYLKSLKSSFVGKIELIPNVADFRHFKKAQLISTKIPHNITAIQKPIIGFVGAIDGFKVDFDIIEHCAQQNPNFSFVLIGPVGHGDNTNRDKLPSSKNIYYLGKLEYAQLPNYIKAFDACIIPYRLNAYTKACSPLKLHEYLSAGKPVVTTNLPAVENFQNMVYIGSTPSDFCRKVRKAIKEDGCELVETRQRVAAENSWDKRMNLIKQIILKDVGL